MGRAGYVLRKRLCLAPIPGPQQTHSMRAWGVGRGAWLCPDTGALAVASGHPPGTRPAGCPLLPLGSTVRAGWGGGLHVPPAPLTAATAARPLAHAAAPLLPSTTPLLSLPPPSPSAPYPPVPRHRRPAWCMVDLVTPPPPSLPRLPCPPHPTSLRPVSPALPVPAVPAPPCLPRPTAPVGATLAAAAPPCGQRRVCETRRRRGAEAVAVAAAAARDPIATNFPSPRRFLAGATVRPTHRRGAPAGGPPVTERQAAGRWPTFNTTPPPSSRPPPPASPLSSPPPPVPGPQAPGPSSSGRRWVRDPFSSLTCAVPALQGYTSRGRRARAGWRAGEGKSLVSRGCLTAAGRPTGRRARRPVGCAAITSVVGGPWRPAVVHATRRRCSHQPRLLSSDLCGAQRGLPGRGCRELGWPGGRDASPAGPCGSGRAAGVIRSWGRRDAAGAGPRQGVCPHLHTVRGCGGAAAAAVPASASLPWLGFDGSGRGGGGGVWGGAAGGGGGKSASALACFLCPTHRRGWWSMCGASGPTLFAVERTSRRWSRGGLAPVLGVWRPAHRWRGARRSCRVPCNPLTRGTSAALSRHCCLRRCSPLGWLPEHCALLRRFLSLPPSSAFTAHAAHAVHIGSTPHPIAQRPVLPPPCCRHAAADSHSRFPSA